MSEEATKLLRLLVGVSGTLFVWEMYLVFRQLCLHKRTIARPNEVAEIISEEQYGKARLYSIDRLHFKMFRISVEFVITVLMLTTGYYGRIWSFCESSIAPLPLFLAAQQIISLLLDLPLSLYENFVVEELHGFNKYTLRFYAVDTLKKQVVSYLFIAPISMGAAWLIDNSGEYFFIYLWVFVSLIVLAMMTIYPALIAPLFDTYIPLPDGELKEAIEALAASLDYPLKKLYVVDGSKRSAHSNAYMYGFWKNKRIVLYDTLLSGEEKKKVEEAMGKKEEEKEDGEEKKKKKKGMNIKEVVAVLGHELGHWSESHVVIQLFISEMNIFFAFYIFSLCHKNPILGEAFGFTSTIPSLISLLVVMQHIMGLYSELFGVLSVFITRSLEFSADAFSAKLGHSSSLRSALIQLNDDNLGLPVNDWLYSTCRFTHPPVPERLAALAKHEKRQ